MIDSGEVFEILYEAWKNESRETKKESEGAKEMTDKRPILGLIDLINLSSEIDFLYREALMKAKEDDDLGLEDFVEQSYSICRKYMNIMARSLEDDE